MHWMNPIFTIFASPFSSLILIGRLAIDRILTSRGFLRRSILLLLCGLLSFSAVVSSTHQAIANPSPSLAPGAGVTHLQQTPVQRQVQLVDLSQVDLSQVDLSQTQRTDLRVLHPPIDPIQIASLPVISWEQLPPEAQITINLIYQGGPFPYDRDGIEFQNRERLLPQQPAGYYREYTVQTPGATNRGARRIVAGQNGEMYYTSDHYSSFSQVQY